MTYSMGPVTKRIRQLCALRPNWAIEYKPEGGEGILVLYVYKKPAVEAEGVIDLVSLRKLRFPRQEGARVYAGPTEWLDEQIGRCPLERVPSFA